MGTAFGLCTAIQNMGLAAFPFLNGRLRDATGGYTATQADSCVIIPTVNANNITPHSEAFQAVVWHLFVSHPDLKVNQTKWESVAAPK